MAAGLYVVVAAALGAVLLREPLSPRKCLGIILAGVAILLLSAPDKRDRTPGGARARGANPPADARTDPFSETRWG